MTTYYYLLGQRSDYSTYGPIASARTRRGIIAAARKHLGARVSIDAVNDDGDMLIVRYPRTDDPEHLCFVRRGALRPDAHGISATKEMFADHDAVQKP